MRKLITDKKLLFLLDEIEVILGPVSLGIMPQEQRVLARCSMQFNSGKGWTLLHIPESETSQATLCHELAHLVLLIEGWPVFLIDSHLPASDYLIQTVSMLKNLVLHIDVWKIVKNLGFDEKPDYKTEIDYLISQVQESHLLIDALPTEILHFRTAYLAQGLLCPSELETRTQLHNAASCTMPKALELAGSIIQVFERLSPLSQQLSAEALSEICGLLQIHRGILIASWPDILEQNFRSRILS
ncbi:MAG: hypothetical protein ACL7AY_09005 [Candidatus Arsenophonus phytopathogenicus]